VWSMHTYSEESAITSARVLHHTTRGHRASITSSGGSRLQGPSLLELQEWLSRGIAVLDVPLTRTMYLRRLRTLAETFLSPGGRLEQVSGQARGSSTA